MMNMAQLMEFKLKTRLWYLMAQNELRQSTLAACKTEAQKDKWRDRWSQEDAAAKIADAINNLRT